MFNDHPLTTITIPHQSTHHCFSAAAQHAFYFSTTYQWHMSGFSWAERRSSGLHETCSNCTQTFSFWVLCQTRSNSEKGRPPSILMAILQMTSGGQLFPPVQFIPPSGLEKIEEILLVQLAPVFMGQMFFLSVAQSKLSNQ